MTKISTLNQALGKKDSRSLMPIKITHRLSEDKMFYQSDFSPSDFEELILVQSNYRYAGFDLIYGRDVSDAVSGHMLLGQWNSGLPK